MGGHQGSSGSSDSGTSTVSVVSFGPVSALSATAVFRSVVPASSSSTVYLAFISTLSPTASSPMVNVPSPLSVTPSGSSKRSAPWPDNPSVTVTPVSPTLPLFMTVMVYTTSSPTAAPSTFALFVTVSKGAGTTALSYCAVKV